MNWTSPADLRRQVRKLWDRGQLLAELAGGESIFPRRLTLKTPTSAQLASDFGAVRDWISQLRTGAGGAETWGDGDEGDGAGGDGAEGDGAEGDGAVADAPVRNQEAAAGGVHGSGKYRIQWREINHRVLGRNRVPAAVWLDSLDQALALIGRRREAARFTELIAQTGRQQPELLPWLRRRPLRAMELAADWPRLLAVVAWLKDHPRPGIYLRQVDIPEVDSKFIEQHRGVLAELFDLALAAGGDDQATTGVAGFCRRHGFLAKPTRLRFRMLEPLPTLPGAERDQDLTLRLDVFADLKLPVSRVFITENEINFLAFPRLPASLVIFGAGYGFEEWFRISWLQKQEIHYWGDIDTHGFAILNQLRQIFPQARSLLMDRETLLAHRRQWSTEPKPQKRDLPHLQPAEAALYDDLRHHRLGPSVRLEQERIAYSRLLGILGILGI